MNKKVGIVFGAFCPLHKGHLNLIMQAKKQNDMCYVIVCGYDNDRGGNILPLSKRYRYVKETFKNDTLIKVYYINDTELKIDQSMSPHNWFIWYTYLMSQFNQTHSKNDTFEMTWYVAEKEYVKPLENFGEKVILCDRTTLNISGTMIRKNPLKYWEYITPVFRKVFSHNILITGTASEGKTTLTQDIARYFGLPYSEEMGRIRLMETNKSDIEMDFGDFHYNLYEQNNVNAKNIDSLANPGIIISDTDNLVTLMYAKMYAEDDKFALSKDDYNVLYSIAKQQNKHIKWNKIFVLAPKGEFINDGVRYMGHSSLKFRQALFNILIDLLKEFGFKYEILNYGYEENYLRVKKYIEGVLNNE